MPNGLSMLFGPMSAQCTNTSMLTMGNLNKFLIQLQQGHFVTLAGVEVIYVGFGNLAFNLGLLCIQSYYKEFICSAMLNDAQAKCNKAMRLARLPSKTNSHGQQSFLNLLHS
jgi:hypothetical protein